MYDLKVLNVALDRAMTKQEPPEILVAIISELVFALETSPHRYTSKVVEDALIRVRRSRNSLIPLTGNDAKKVWQQARNDMPWLERIFVSKKPSIDFEIKHEGILEERALKYIQDAEEDIASIKLVTKS